MKCPFCKGTGDIPVDQTTPGIMLRAQRDAKGLTQQELADKAGLSRGQVANFEVGRTDVPLKTLGKLASALGCSMKDLVP